MCLSPSSANSRAPRAASLVAAVLAVAVSWPAVPAAAQEAEPQVVPAPGVVATQTAPATLSAEEALYQQLIEMRQLPRPAPGQEQSQEVYMKAVGEQLANSLALTDEYLAKYPTGPHADEVVLQRLETIYFVAVVNNNPLDEFRAEISKVLTSERTSQNVKGDAEFMRIKVVMQELQRELMSDQVMAEQQKQNRWREALQKVAHEYLGQYPKHPRAVEFYAVLVQAALAQDDIAAARSVLEQVRESLPDDPAVASFEQMIRESQAAASRPAATQPSPATQPSAATQPGDGSHPGAATRPVASRPAHVHDAE